LTDEASAPNSSCNANASASLSADDDNFEKVFPEFD